MKENWNTLCRFFPKGWSKKGIELGAFTRSRNIPSTKKLLRLFLIHLSDGLSLRESVTLAKVGKICNISDVGLLKRLRLSGEWFRWMNLEFIKEKGISLSPPEWLKKFNVKNVDASIINEQGIKGSVWRLHYSYSLFEMKCDQFKITKQQIGETFLNFNITKGDLLIGDRAYGRIKGMVYVKSQEGEFLTRIKNKAFTILLNEKEISLNDLLKSLTNAGQIGDWIVVGKTDEGCLPMRICAIRKTDTEIEKSLKKERRLSSRKGTKLNAETLDLCKYVILATSLLDQVITAKCILELYRYRWQIEIAFKRLKSIFSLGNLPKYEDESCKAWLHGKMFVALLAQAIVDKGRFFSPWGM
jgi:hypothetical protein